MITQLLERLKRGSIESFVWQGIGVGSLFVMHSVLANKLNVEGYGLFSFSLSIATILVLFSTMGWPALLLKLIPQYMRSQQWGLLKGVLFKSHQFSLFLSVLLSFLLMIFSKLTSNENHADAFFYAAMLLPLLSMIALRRRIYMGLQNVRGSIIPDEIILPVLVVAGVFVIGIASMADVVVLYVSSAGAVFVVTLIWLWQLLPTELKAAKSNFEIKAWLVLALPLFLGGVSQMILSQSGTFILGLNGDMLEVGLFSAAFRLAMFITFVMTAVNVIGMPMLASAFHQKSASELKEIFIKTQRWSFFGSIPVFVVLMVFPGDVLSFFGEEFKQGALMLQILVIGQMANAAAGLSGSFLAVADEQKFYASSMMVCALIAVASMVLFVPVWGAIAAAIAYSCSLALLSLCQYYKANKSLNLMVPVR